MNKELQSFIKNYTENRISFEKTVFFASKKNTVFLFEDKIFKFYVWGDIEKEFEILKKCEKSGISVPEIKHKENNILVLEYIKPDLDYTENPDIKIPEVIRWLNVFHKKIQISKGDQRLHNYILNNNKIYGIDFEESEKTDTFADFIDLMVTIYSKYGIKKVEENLKHYDKSLQLKNIIDEMNKNILNRRKWNENIESLETGMKRE
ncbi:MAG: RIO1 family regulatory kinase/ATPase [Candidatus Muiribacteriota bacterium]